MGAVGDTKCLKVALSPLVMCVFQSICTKLYQHLYTERILCGKRRGIVRMPESLFSGGMSMGGVTRSMRRLFKKIILILDGTPRVTGKRQSGQSLVELALVTPLLIMLLAGLVEIGWFANNFLTLLDVARAGARRGATLQDDLSARTWESDFRENTYLDIGALPADYQSQGFGVMPYSTGSVDPNDPDPAVIAEQAQRRAFRITEGPTDAHCDESIAAGFYSEVICLMLDSLDPLRFNSGNDVDEIVVSGFALEMVEDPTWFAPATPPTRPEVTVVGRFPSNANECDASVVAAGADAPTPLEPRDPFDFNQNSFVDVYPSVPGGSVNFVSNAHFSEMYGGVLSTDTLDWGYDSPAADVTHAEKQVGFVWTGNHRIGETMCVGSEWTVSEVEDLFNLNTFVFNDDADRSLIPGQGLVLVEIYWEHKLLLNLPFFTVLNDRFTLNVWSAFPMQAVQPNILFYD